MIKTPYLFRISTIEGTIFLKYPATEPGIAERVARIDGKYDAIRRFEIFLNESGLDRFGQGVDYNICKPQSLHDVLIRGAESTHLVDWELMSGYMPGYNDDQYKALFDASKAGMVLESYGYREDYEGNCLMVLLSEADSVLLREVASLIDDDDILKQEDTKEPKVLKNHHITIKYGIAGNLHDVKMSVRGTVGKVSGKFGKLGVFRNVEHDVLFLSVDSASVDALNQKVSHDLISSETYGEYIPHITLAYLRPGCGERYIGLQRLFEDLSFTTDELVFSDSENNHYTVSF